MRAYIIDQKLVKWVCMYFCMDAYVCVCQHKRARWLACGSVYTHHILSIYNFTIACVQMYTRTNVCVCNLPPGRQPPPPSPPLYTHMLDTDGYTQAIPQIVS